MRRRDVPLTRQFIAQNIAKLTEGNPVTIEKLRSLSPVLIPDEPQAQTLLFIQRIFAPSDYINVVTRFQAATVDGKQKCMPRGSGTTRSASLWQDLIAKDGIPQSEAGAWVRMNPVGSGTGQGGAITDNDIQRHLHVLLECDDVELEKQASLLANLALPIVSITESGSRSLHALVRVACSDAVEFAQLTDELSKRLRVLGVDTTNRNPSRLTRLPGAMRSTDVGTPVMQRLVYLNPEPTRRPIVTKEVK
ncbi:MAG: hypothetical protein EOP84_09855 [Verrucomicrobiaceae bacterium]|nr:MAG: hypothetical protein EOP84_09855 [Verrucomicrobiaceae bacterium]